MALVAGEVELGLLARLLHRRLRGEARHPELLGRRAEDRAVLSGVALAFERVAEEHGLPAHRAHAVHEGPQVGRELGGIDPVDAAGVVGAHLLRLHLDSPDAVAEELVQPPAVEE
ncbi:MAG: hypothetical protein ACK559_33295, partial [bacterium]